MELTAVTLPDISLAWNNYVLVSPKEATLLPHGEAAPDNYVQIEGFTFNAKAHPKIEQGCIAMGKSHRFTIRPGEGVLPPKVLVTPTSPERENIVDAVEITFSLNLLVAVRKTVVAEAKLADHISQVYSGQVLHAGQNLYCLFNDIPMELRVLSLSIPVTGFTSKSEEGESQMTLDYQAAKRGLLRQGLTTITVEEVKGPERNQFMQLDKASARAIINPNWDFSKLGIGGLDSEFGMIFRRAFASRLFPPDLIKKLGIRHVKGILLYGPPGTGKTLIARQIGTMLGTGKIEPLVVNGPEILNKFVGVAEENIRKLFEPAEKDEEENGDQSDLHVIIFDEIDAICKARGSVRNGTGVHDTVVNQLLSKMDGVKKLNNILVIGMTNRKDMIDPALLREGRLEVKIEIGLPDRKGRLQILNIHTTSMRENRMMGPDVDLEKLSDMTRNMSGAEIEGLVKSAASYALYGNIDITKFSMDPKFIKDMCRRNVMVKMAHFEKALEEVKPAFGVAEDDFATLIRGTMLNVGPEYDKIMTTVRTAINQLTSSANTQVISVLLEGPPGSGKSTMAARLAVESQFPFIKLVAPEQFVGMGEAEKCNSIDKVFMDSYKSPLSMIMLDNIERLLEYVNIGPRFSNVILQTLMVLLQRLPQRPERKLLIIATSSNLQLMKMLGLRHSFNMVLRTPMINKPDMVMNVFKSMQLQIVESDKAKMAQYVCNLPHPLSIKSLVMVLEMANQGQGSLTYDRFLRAIIDAGLAAPESLDDVDDEQKLTD